MSDIIWLICMIVAKSVPFGMGIVDVEKRTISLFYDLGSGY